MTVASPADLRSLRAAGRVVAEALSAMRAAVAPGVTTGRLDEIAASVLRRHGARSAPRILYGFPATTCISVNDQIVHGVPGARVLQPGDLVTLDVTVSLDGYVADAARTVAVPPAAPLARRLVRCARAAFQRAVEAATPGRPVNAIGAAVEREVKKHGFHVLRELTGHGVGRGIHEPPAVPNWEDPRAADVLTPGLVLAIEPIVAAQPTRSVEEPDGWTLRTYHHCLSAHHENTVVVREGRPLLLTAE